jgi:hypothetical protein
MRDGTDRGVADEDLEGVSTAAGTNPRAKPV